MLGDDTRAALNGAPCAVAIAVAGYAEQPPPLAADRRRLRRLARERCAPSRPHARSPRRRGPGSRALEVVAIPTYAYTGLMAPPVGESIDVLLQEAERALKAMPGVEGRAVYGLTGEELAAFGDEVDLLVVGSRGYGPVRRLVLGSTSDYLARHARCSLLVLPRGRP